MSENYSQSLEVTVSSKTKSMQWLGIICVLLGLGFVVLAAFNSLYWLIAVGGFLMIGIVYIHLFNQTAKEYIYDLSPKRLVVAKKDVVNRTTRILNVMFEDVVNFGPMSDMLDDSDILAAENAHDSGIYQLVFKEKDKYGRLLFKPDSYMIALIERRVDTAPAHLGDILDGNDVKDYLS